MNGVYGIGSKNILVGLFGAGGFGREVMPFAKETISMMSQSEPETRVEIVFVETEPKIDRINGYKLMSEAEFVGAKTKEKYFNIAVGSSVARQEVSERLFAAGCHAVSLSANSAIVCDENIIGEGAIICNNVVITSNASIGRFFHANIYSYVAHDCEIGDFVTFAPRVSCNGNVKIENHAYIGAGAVVKEGKFGKPLIVGEGAVVGMGAVVTKDVAPYTTVVGNPARLMEKK